MKNVIYNNNNNNKIVFGLGWGKPNVGYNEKWERCGELMNRQSLISFPLFFHLLLFNSITMKYFHM